MVLETLLQLPNICTAMLLVLLMPANRATPHPQPSKQAPSSDLNIRLTDAGPAPEHAALRHEDFVHDPPEDNIPPPAYGDHYGAIENEQDGFGTNARVAG